jgi:nucleotide-binding universal stress UspA family protein
VIAMLYQRPVVVGVDGSEAALAALDWAVREAVDRDRRLRIIHAFIWPLFNHVSRPAAIGPAHQRAAGGRARDHRRGTTATTMSPGLVVEAMIHSERPAPSCSPRQRTPTSWSLARVGSVGSPVSCSAP